MSSFVKEKVQGFYEKDFPVLCKVQDLINKGGTPTLIDLDLAQLHPLCREDEQIIHIRYI